MSRVLVVHFSRDGHTRAIAREIAKGCGGEAEAITERGSRAGLWAYLRSALEALFGVAPTLASTKTGRRGLSQPVGATLNFHAEIDRVPIFAMHGPGGRALMRAGLGVVG